MLEFKEDDRAVELMDDCADFYIEAGNHTDLLHISSSEFRKLFTDARHANICVH